MFKLSFTYDGDKKKTRNYTSPASHSTNFCRDHA